MKYIALLICALFTIGCAERTRLNPGAQLSVYEANTQWMFETLPAGCNKATTVRLGYYSTSDGSITLNEQLRGYAAARVLVHELSHAYDHQKPRDMWELLARYQSVDFNFNPHKVSP